MSISLNLQISSKDAASSGFSFSADPMSFDVQETALTTNTAAQQTFSCEQYNNAATLLPPDHPIFVDQPVVFPSDHPALALTSVPHLEYILDDLCSQDTPLPLRKTCDPQWSLYQLNHMIARKEHTQAKKMLAQISLSDIDNPSLLCKFASICEALKMLPEATIAYEQALSKDPNNPAILSAAASIYIQQQDLDKGYNCAKTLYEQMEKASAIHPDYTEPETASLWVLVLFLNGELKRAQEVVSIHLMQFPNNPLLLALQKRISKEMSIIFHPSNPDPTLLSTTSPTLL